jgi:uncharacterized protein (TIGR02466 family)
MVSPVVHALFSIPVYTVICDIDVSDAVKFLDQQHEYIPNSYANTYGNKSVDDYILDHPECSAIKTFALHHMEKFAREILAWEFEYFQLTQSWITCKEPGEQHGPHYHPNSMLSAVFYFQQPDNTYSPLTFHRPEIISQLMNTFAPAYSEEKLTTAEFAWNQWSIPPQKNSLIIFPSWINHSVPVNTSDKPRMSLAMNGIPTGVFGSRVGSTEIDIGRLR